MNEEPKIGDQVWDERRGEWFEIRSFCEDSGTQLDDGRWVCASKFEHVTTNRLGMTRWKFDPDKLDRDEIGPTVGDRVKTALTWRSISGATDRVVQLDFLNKFARVDDLELIAARRNGGVNIWKLNMEREPGPYLPGDAPEPCFICGDEDDHLGHPHGVATGDGKVRADVLSRTFEELEAEAVCERTCKSMQCLYGCRRAADELTRLGQEMDQGEDCRWSLDPEDERRIAPIFEGEFTMVHEGDAGYRFYRGDEPMKLVSAADEWRTPEPVPNIDLGLCARIIELEAEVGRRGREFDTCERLLRESYVENNKLRAELANERDLEGGARRLLPGFQAEVVRLKNENISLQSKLSDCNNGWCKAAYDQNEQGGEARDIVARAAKKLDIQLGEDMRGEGGIWAKENMARVLLGIDLLRDARARLQAELRTAQTELAAPRTELAKANEKLALIEEALEDPWHAGDTIRAIIEQD